MTGKMLLYQLLASAAALIEFKQMVAGATADRLRNLFDGQNLNCIDKYAGQLGHLAPAQIAALQG